MARYYDVIFDYGEFPINSGGTDPFPPDAITTSPYALMAVWRYRYPVTFSRTTGESISSGANGVTAATRLRDATLIVCDDLSQVSVSTTKGNHVGQMQATLLPSMNYLTEMFPGDWCAVWMVNDQKTLLSLIDRIKNNQPCNKFYDGLKFIGKLSSVRKKIVQNGAGVLRSIYTINAAAFSEFDAQIYFEPYLAANNVGISTTWLRQTGVDIVKTIESTQNGQGGIGINDVMPVFLEAFYGKGLPPNQSIQSTQGLPSSTNGPSSNTFIIPDPVANILGVTQGTKPNGQKGWNDICEVLIGIQKYQLSSGQLQAQTVTDLQNGKATSTGPQSIFTPDGVPNGSTTRRRITGFPLLGVFLPSAPQFNGQKTIWSIFQQFLNPVVNEMFTTLRVNPSGDVMPTLVIRQLPFNSGLISDLYRPKTIEVLNDSNSPKTSAGEANNTSHAKSVAAINSIDNIPPTQPPARQLTLTRMVEVPRWRIHPILIQSVDLGRSDSLRFNFVHVYGETGLQSQTRTGYIVRDPPIMDDIDIARSGLRPYMVTVNCAPSDTLNRKAGDWMYIIGDILMGQHLTLTGTMEVRGIQSPISVGDNIEFDDHIFHIETVTHSFQMSPDGKKFFGTSLALSHGVKGDQEVEGDDLALFTGTSQNDLQRFSAPASAEYSYSPNKPSDPSSAATVNGSLAGDYEPTNNGSNGNTA